MTRPYWLPAAPLSGNYDLPDICARAQGAFAAHGPPNCEWHAVRWPVLGSEAPLSHPWHCSSQAHGDRPWPPAWAKATKSHPLAQCRGKPPSSPEPLNAQYLRSYRCNCQARWGDCPRWGLARASGWSQGFAHISVSLEHQKGTREDDRIQKWSTSWADSLWMQESCQTSLRILFKNTELAFECISCM